VSSQNQIALAEHLSSIGARFYGAYWCSFCFQQRSMFGAGGSRRLPYVECASDGYQSQAAVCRAKPQLTGYPTWEINGKLYGGLRSLSELQTISGFDANVKFAEYRPPPPPPRPPPPPGGFKPPAVDVASTSGQVALAKHLRQTGATFFGAYWCRFCSKQRSLFGAEAAAVLPYVECAEDGYKSSSTACQRRDVNAYPTWEIKGQLYSGFRSLDELATLSGFGDETAARANSAEKPPPIVSLERAVGEVRANFGEDCSLTTGGEDCKK